MTIISKMKTVFGPAIIVTLAAPSLAAAQVSTELSGLYACETIVGDDAKLRCFLNETAKLRRAATPQIAAPNPAPQIAAPVPAPSIVETPRPSEAPSGVETVARVETPKADNPEKFIPLVKDLVPKERTLTIATTATYGRNKYVRFALENGEVWQQIDSGRVRLGKGNPDKITIRKASLGSYLAQINDKSPSIRVRRIR